MTREEFSAKLVECRVISGCGKNELCRRTGFTFNQLRRLETAANNFSIDNVILYLKALKFGIYIRQNNKKWHLFNDRKIFAQHFKEYRNNTKMSLREFSAFSGVSLTMLGGLENGNKNTSIDYFLLCLDKLNCQILFDKIK